MNNTKKTVISSGKQFIRKLKFGLATMLLFISSMLISSHAANAQTSKGNLGLGLVIGDITGITGKYLYEDNKGIAASVGLDENHFHLDVDHIWDTKINLDGDRFDVYYGLGLQLHTHDNHYYENYKVRHEDEANLGVRVPLGIQHFFREPPIQVFFEIAPTLVFLGHTGLDINFALGSRYFF